MKIAIYPYMNGSKSARALAQGLGIKVLKREGVRRNVGILINWGSSKWDRPIAANRVINERYAIELASNKLRTFERFAATEVPTVPWTTDANVARKWQEENATVVVRYKLSGHSGEGIEIIEPDYIIPDDAPLFTKYVKKKDEYRIHVFQGKVIFQQRKARKKDVPDDQVNWKVRNLNGGFIFANDGVVAPDPVQQAAIAAVEALGLDFGAADVGFHAEQGTVVYEVNTACGLQGKNLETYVENFLKLV